MPPGAKFSKMSKIHVLHLRYNLYFFSKFCRNTCFFPIIDDALSVAILTARGQSTRTLLSTLTRELKISFAVVVSIIGTNPRISSVTDKASSMPRINMTWKTLHSLSTFLCFDIYCTCWETRLSNLWKTKSEHGRVLHLTICPYYATIQCPYLLFSRKLQRCSTRFHSRLTNCRQEVAWAGGFG